MSRNQGLATTMSLEAFENGYWYATELKAFAAALGVSSASKLRKDELEAAIKQYLSTGSIRDPQISPAGKRGAKDSTQGLSPDLVIHNYTNDRETKEFLLREARRRQPAFKIQSGTRYSLNRWREEQIAKGRRLTYGELVDHFIELNSRPRVPLRTPHGRYNNFVADYRAANKGADHKEIVQAWKELKRMDAPKTFSAWLAVKREER